MTNPRPEGLGLVVIELLGSCYYLVRVENVPFSTPSM